jgi:acetyl esterase/lipase
MGIDLKKLLFVLVALVLLVAVGSTGYGIWWYYFDGRAPTPRPDLVRLPSALGGPPRGFPTTNALLLAFARGRIELIDTEAEAANAGPVKEQLNIEYGRVGGRPLLLDLYSPPDLNRPVPGVLFIHGGGWEQGDKGDYKIYTTYFASQGYVVGTVGYRLKKEAKYPAAIEDVKCAVRWMRSNAESLQVDPDRIAVIGGSAGGHLAMMIGYSSDVPEMEGAGGWADTSSAVRAVVNIYGPTDLTTDYARNHPTITTYLDQSYADAPGLYEQGSPLFHLDAGDPPTLIIHGTLDLLVPVTQADRLAVRLEELGIPYWYDRIDGWPHTMDLARPVHERVKNVVGAFFNEHLDHKP